MKILWYFVVFLDLFFNITKLGELKFTISYTKSILIFSLLGCTPTLVYIYIIGIIFYRGCVWFYTNSYSEMDSQYFQFDIKNWKGFFFFFFFFSEKSQIKDIETIKWRLTVTSTIGQNMPSLSSLSLGIRRVPPHLSPYDIRYPQVLHSHNY